MNKIVFSTRITDAVRKAPTTLVLALLALGMGTGSAVQAQSLGQASAPRQERSVQGNPPSPDDLPDWAAPQQQQPRRNARNRQRVSPLQGEMQTKTGHTKPGVPINGAAWLALIGGVYAGWKLIYADETKRTKLPV